MVRKTCMLILVMALAFTLVANATWRSSQTKRDVKFLNVPLPQPPGLFVSRGASGLGKTRAIVVATPTITSSTTTSSTSATHWARKRYDWEGCGSPTEATANVSISITPNAKSSGTVRPSGRSTAHGHGSASAYASQSGGTPYATASGHAKVDVFVSHVTSSTWSFTISRSVPSASFALTGSGGSLTKEDSGSLALGGSLKFSKSGAQIYATTTSYASASQTNDCIGLGSARCSVSSFIFHIP